MRRRLLSSMLIAAACSCGGAAVHAQLPPNTAWLTVSSQHFRITYEPGLEELARHAGAAAERAHAALATLVADAPDGIIDIVVTDNLDLTNGYATPFPSNRVVVFAKPPVDVLELQYTRDWIELVVTHELAHIFHLDVSGRLGRLVRAIFGRLPSSWPVFSAVATPGWSIEGLAVGVESSLTGFGRVHGSYHEMVVRTASLADEFDDLDRLTSSSPVWPGAAREYIYGSLFMDYLTRRFGPETSARLVRSTAGAIIPPQLWFGSVARDALGISFRRAYDDWRNELRQRYRTLAQTLTDQGLTSAQQLTRHKGAALYPRFSRDGRLIAYGASDQRTPSRTRVIDANSGAEVWSRVRNDLAPAAWLPDNSLLTSDLDFTDPFHIYSDLVIHRAGDRDRITSDARLQDPDVAPDGRRAVAVENGGGTNRLVLIDPANGSRKAITQLDPETHWAMPRFAPAGDRIAVGRWQRGGSYDVVVLDTLGNVLQQAMQGHGVNAAPAWSPDARWIVFSSDRSGISNLYATRVDGTPGTNQVRQITNVLGGAFYPDVAPDGSAIVYSAYHHDGFRIERIPFDPAQWRDPVATELSDLEHDRGTHAESADFTAAMAAAVQRADTTTSAPRPYSAVSHLRPHFWVPILPEGGTRNHYWGVYSLSEDLVGRHAWELSLALDPGTGRTQGDISYSYRGLPTIAALGVHPHITAAAQRDWDVRPVRDSLNKVAFHIDDREDVAALGVTFTRPRWRSSYAISFSGELVRRARHLQGAGSRSLRDPEDDLIGVRANTFYARYVAPPFSISRENGFVTQIGGRERIERNPRTLTIDGNTVTFDGGYRELSSWNAAYLALPLPGFARHVLAGRVSGLYRAGPGASVSELGGATSSSSGLPSLLDDAVGVSRFLPVRGFEEGARFGTRAWSASAEYRFPIAFITRSLRPLPIFVDRISGTLFADAGQAWCDETAFQRYGPSTCTRRADAPAPLLSVGPELTVNMSIYGFGFPLRFGLPAPIQGPAGTRSYFYLVVGHSF